MATVGKPANRSEKIMTRFLLERSTTAPAIGVISRRGTKLKKLTSPRTVACPVTCQAQIVSAKLVMLVPSKENTWPAHINVKLDMPLVSSDDRFVSTGPFALLISRRGVRRCFMVFAQQL